MANNAKFKVNSGRVILPLLFNRIYNNGRKKVYKNAGSTPRDWKEYIKHI